MPTLFLLRGGHTTLVKSKTPEEIRDALPKFKGKDFLGFEKEPDIYLRVSDIVAFVSISKTGTHPKST